MGCKITDSKSEMCPYSCQRQVVSQTGQHTFYLAKLLIKIGGRGNAGDRDRAGVAAGNPPGTGVTTGTAGEAG